MKMLNISPPEEVKMYKGPNGELVDTPEEVRLYKGPNGKLFTTQYEAMDALVVQAFASWYEDNRGGLHDDYGPPVGEDVARWLATHRQVIQQFYYLLPVSATGQ